MAMAMLRMNSDDHHKSKTAIKISIIRMVMIEFHLQAEEQLHRDQQQKEQQKQGMKYYEKF